jgi:hypothetical protein
MPSGLPAIPLKRAPLMLLVSSIAQVLKLLRPEDDPPQARSEGC